jgi:D-serine deaminase-like pyridoxal phosphate-dependent protein
MDTTDNKQQQQQKQQEDTDMQLWIEFGEGDGELGARSNSKSKNPIKESLSHAKRGTLQGRRTLSRRIKKNWRSFFKYTNPLSTLLFFLMVL